MMLIEADKRGPNNQIALTYSKQEERFYVPKNVHLIGTMNTADRSLSIVDYALRRRFSFINLFPNFNDSFKAFLTELALSLESLAMSMTTGLIPRFLRAIIAPKAERPEPITMTFINPYPELFLRPHKFVIFVFWIVWQSTE